MIPKKNTFWYSEKQNSVIYISEYYYQGTGDKYHVSHIKVADFRTLKTLYFSVKDIQTAIDSGKLRQVG